MLRVQRLQFAALHAAREHPANDLAGRVNHLGAVKLGEFRKLPSLAHHQFANARAVGVAHAVPPGGHKGAQQRLGVAGKAVQRHVEF